MSGALKPQVKSTLNLLSDGLFHSGNELAEKLAISRTAVWKQIQVLTGMGLAIDAVSGKGYRLQFPVTLLESARINEHLAIHSKARIEKTHILDQVDSTNTYLAEQTPEFREKALICLAESQTSGRGRTGKTWVSPFAANIYLSLRWYFAESPGRLTGLSLAIGVAVTRALASIGVVDAGLKWPNDILWKGKKLGGILIDLKADPHGPSDVIIGVGINCRIASSVAGQIDQPWVDLQQIHPDAALERNRLVALLINQFLLVVESYLDTGLDPYLDEWRARDVYRGKVIKLKQGPNDLTARVEGISDEGFLLLETAAGIKAYASGEVSFIRPDDLDE